MIRKSTLLLIVFLFVVTNFMITPASADEFNYQNALAKYSQESQYFQEDQSSQQSQYSQEDQSSQQSQYSQEDQSSQK